MLFFFFLFYTVGVPSRSNTSSCTRLVHECVRLTKTKPPYDLRAAALVAMHFRAISMHGCGDCMKTARSLHGRSTALLWSVVETRIRNRTMSVSNVNTYYAETRSYLRCLKHTENRRQISCTAPRAMVT